MFVGLIQAQNLFETGLVYFCARKIIESLLCGFDNSIFYEFSAFTSALFWTFNHALPLHNGPNITAVFGEFTEDRFVIDLTVTKGAITPGPIFPIPITAKSASLSVGQKFTVLNVEGFDELVVMVYLGQIVQLLKHKMTRVVQDVHCFVISGRF